MGENFVKRASSKVKGVVTDAPMVDKRDKKLARSCILVVICAILSFLVGILAIFISKASHFHAGFVLGLLCMFTVPITNCLVLWWPNTWITLGNIVANLIVVPSVLGSFRDLAHSVSDLKTCKTDDQTFTTVWGGELTCHRAKTILPACLTVFVMEFIILGLMICGVVYVCYLRERKGLVTGPKVNLPAKLKRKSSATTATGAAGGAESEDEQLENYASKEIP